jgi:hypothetical protein
MTVGWGGPLTRIHLLVGHVKVEALHPSSSDGFRSGPFAAQDKLKPRPLGRKAKRSGPAPFATTEYQVPAPGLGEKLS